MNNTNLNSEYPANNEEVNFKNELFKYFFFWKYFLVFLSFCFLLAFTYNKYSSDVFSTNAKIKILDKKDSALELPSAEDLFSSSKINLENEIEVIKSYSILEQVVRNLNLTTSVSFEGDVMSSLVLDYPFTLTHKLLIDDITEMLFKIDFTDKGLEIIDYQNVEKEYIFEDFSTYEQEHDLPFQIHNVDKNTYLDESYDEGYTILFKSLDQTVSMLKQKIILQQVGKSSDIITINFNSTSSVYAEQIVNELITVFNNDGIKDRQLVHKRTIDFVNDRYLNLSGELDSIEIDKQFFKINNNLIDFKANSSVLLDKTNSSEQKIFSNENKMFIISSILKSLSNSDLELLPANFVAENTNINSLISSYNEMIIKQKKLILSVGPNNPSVIQLDNSLKDSKSNIILSLKNYLLQLDDIKLKLSKNLDKYISQFSLLPEKEKILRNIERNQKIKESLYLFLLEKREEAEVSYAITEPSIKVVEYAFSNTQPISNKTINFLYAFIIGMIIPFSFIYLMFLFNTKIHSKNDIDALNLGASVIGEIPQIIENNVIFDDPSQRSVLAEAFRMLSSNLKYMLPNTETCSVIISTSTIKGEGKTFSAVNTSLALSSLNKKVLLIGCDLRNPQLHKYLDLDKSVKGLVNYLVDDKNNWRDNLVKFFKHHPTHDILLSGALPPNPVQLLTNGNLQKLIDDARNDYDYIILDTAPTILVTDTITIAHLADAILYVSRANLTEREILSFPKELISSGKIKNVGIVLNGIGSQNKYGYSYGYQYGYGYKYSYNYGYGYGYEEDKDS